MRKFWIGTSITLAILLAMVMGVWVGAVKRDWIAGALGAGPRQDKDSNVAAATGDGRQMTAGSDHPTPTSKTLYRCGMHPWIIQDHPGACPICHMPLAPIQGGTIEEMGTGGPVVTIDPAVVQNMGVQTAAVTKGSLHKTVRVVGTLEVPETGLYDITLKVGGYIDKLYADTTGMHIHKGEALFDLYSPELTLAEEELIAARKSVAAMTDASPEILKQTQDLMASERRKLELLDIPDSEIDAVAKQEHAPKTITIRSPAEGHLEEKMIVQGSSVQAGMKLMRIEDHRTMWLEAKVYEGQLSLVKVGQTADATLDAMPGKTFSGKITFINPHLDHMNRTTSVRIELENPDFALKPGMYASVQIQAQPVDDAVLVPGTAVIDTGTRQIVFVQEKEKGHFSPRLVTVGLSGDDDQVEVLSGLMPGERVVTSGQFLMDVESRSLEATQKFLSQSAATTTSLPSATIMATTPETVPAIAAARATNGESDAVVKSYLIVASYLQQDHADNKPADVAGLLQASGDLAEHAAMPENRSLAKALRDAIAPMGGQSLDAQHKAFENVGGALIALIAKDPPSTGIAPTLYIVHCPMENADWLQTAPAVNNPFLPSMRTCGSVTQTLQLAPAK